MFNLKQPKIAIDIGSSSIKILEMSGSGQHKKLLSLGLEILPREVVEAGIIRDAETVSKILGKLLKRLKLNGKRRKVSISVSGVSTLIKRVVLPIEDDSDLDETIYEEAKQQFHHNLEDMYFRYQEISSAFLDQGLRAFLLVAAKIETIEQYVELMHSQGLKVELTDCDVFSLANMFNYSYPIADVLIMVINFGAAKTQVIFCYNNEFLFCREIFTGGNEFTQRIADELRIDFDNAESIKISASMGDQSLAEKIRPIISPLNQQISLEMNSTIAFFQNDEIGGRFEKIDCIYLCGGAAATLDLSTSISSLLKVPVQVINPFQKIDIKPSGIDMDYVINQGPLYGISVGLGLRDSKQD